MKSVQSPSPPHAPPASPRALWAQVRPPGAAAVVAAAVIVLALLGLNIPYFALTPGPTEDVASLTTIEGVKTHAVHGRLLMTTVALHEIRVGEAISSWFDPTVAIVSRAVIIPPGSSEHDVQQQTTSQMDESQVAAAAAALTYLGYHVTTESVGVRVLHVAVDAPAAKVVRSGDVITKADGKTVKKALDLRTEVGRRGVGQVIRLQLMRGTQRLDVTVRTVAMQRQSRRVPVIGIQIEDVPLVRLPLAVSINSMGIGGPSAGLMLALGIVDLLDPKDIAGGRVIAGTGVIDVHGNVGPVGGVQQKVAAARRVKADLFLVPADPDEFSAACSVADHIRVVSVRSLAQAVRTLEGEKVPPDRTCQRGSGPVP